MFKEAYGDAYDAFTISADRVFGEYFGAYLMTKLNGQNLKDIFEYRSAEYNKAVMLNDYITKMMWEYVPKDDSTFDAEAFDIDTLTELITHGAKTEAIKSTTAYRWIKKLEEEAISDIEFAKAALQMKKRTLM